ncbi:MAG TPA: potassium channel family protein [Solirubrobacteraceae bacterium]
MTAPAGTADRAGDYRYGVVLLLTLALLVFIIVAPSADWAYAVAIALEAAALMVVIGTSRERSRVRRVRVLTVGTVGVATIVAVAAGAVQTGAVSLVGAALALAIPLTLVGGLLRLVRARGVTLQVIAGALAIYVLIGLMFAWTVGAAAKWGAHPYFSSGTDGTESSRSYYSFTVLTTTGFGDFTPAQPAGRAIAVVEMLTGQIYLVTVIGVLVGHLAARARAS